MLVLVLLHLLTLEGLEPRQQALAAEAGALAPAAMLMNRPTMRLDARQIRRAARDGGAEEDVLLAAVAVEQERPRPLHQGVERELVLPREGLQRRRRSRGELERLFVWALSCAGGVARPGSRRQRGRRGEARERAPPPGLRAAMSCSWSQAMYSR